MPPAPTPRRPLAAVLCLPLLAAAATLPACGSSAGGGGPDGGSGGSGGNGGSGGSGGGDDPTPITARTLRQRFQCRIDRGVTFHAPRLWSPWPVLTANASGTAYLARLESTSTDPFIPGPRDLVVSTFAANGTVGPATKIASLANDQNMFIAAAPRGAGVAVVWADVGTGAVSFAAFDDAGQATIAPHVVAAGAGASLMPNRLALAAGSDGGFAVAYELASSAGGYQLRLLALGHDGNARGTPRTLAASSTGFVAPTPTIVAAASGDGYALAWTDPGATRGRIVFARANLDGGEVVAPRPISVTDREGVHIGGHTALVARGAGYLAAWSEADWGDIQNFRGASAIVRLVRLDAAGTRLGTPAPLRATEVDVDEVEPSLVAFKDAAAVLWGRGRHIYLCAGCVPDHRIDMLVVDPTDLVPLSAVTTLAPVPAPGATGAGGLLNRDVAVLGSSILTAFNVTFHVNHLSASGAFTCDE
jgi:hypothetical protein